MKFCVLLNDEGQPAKIWRIVDETPFFLFLECEGERITARPDTVWRLT